MDVYGHLLAPSRMHAGGDAARPWISSEVADFDPLATELATNVADDDGGDGLNWDSVGRPGLDPAPWD